MPVLGVQNLPRFKTFGRNRHFYATVTDGARTWRTRFMQSVGNHVEWNESLYTWALSYFYVLFTTDSPAVLYYHTLVSRYPFMREGQYVKTSLLEGKG
jgi:hypothetical protein